ncbi:beta-1,3-galactosyltransferase 5-like [Mercenaria mercenaria]|uniref:beta-1,3-galactosyltransferase 5-like n=1 Tax=Mercenaria mercenaria TaxID=6596 RepID=UPI001E1DC142|nr:beta-1,3-galactosyltransferase 5-like [Mercenaria mercenaria]XP_045186975.1 beta-1,3-galactosyltransferase 5-like [Mercenaria mercenaria]
MGNDGVGNNRERIRLILLTLCIAFCCIQIIFYHTVRKQYPGATSYNFSKPYQVITQPGLLKLINTSIPTYHFNGLYIHENKTFCSSVTNLTILVLVLSSTGNLNKRQALRQTWTNGTFYRPYGTLKALFLLGIGDDADVQNKINKESQLYGDIVQGGFIDTYNNLTLKSTMGFEWATDRCRNAKYVIKTDDDIVINMFKLFQNTILRESECDFHVYCHRQQNIVVRENTSKWYVGQDHFKGWTRYSTYCGGSFVMILNEVVPFIYASIFRTPFFWIEDVLLYGIVLDNIPGLKYKRVRGIDRNLDNTTASIICLKEQKTNCSPFIFMTKGALQIVTLWENILLLYYN